jgi:PAS domain-containing protein
MHDPQGLATGAGGDAVTNDDALALHQGLLNLLDVAVLVANDRAIYVEANDAACRLLARRREEIIGRHLSDFIVDGTRELVDRQWAAFLRAGVQTGSFPLQVAPGDVRMAQFSARANVVPGLHCSFLTEQPARRPSNANAPMLTVCAWTQRVLWKDRWVSLAEYLFKAHGIAVTHGMCPDAFALFDDGSTR